LRRRDREFFHSMEVTGFLLARTCEYRLVVTMTYRPFPSATFGILIAYIGITREHSVVMMDFAAPYPLLWALFRDDV
jgi:hypothetical protein